MKKMYSYILIIFIALAISSCNPMASIKKIGTKQRQAGASYYNGTTTRKPRSEFEKGKITQAQLDKNTDLQVLLKNPNSLLTDEHTEKVLIEREGLGVLSEDVKKETITDDTRHLIFGEFNKPLDKRATYKYMSTYDKDYYTTAYQRRHGEKPTIKQLVAFLNDIKRSHFGYWVALLPAEVPVNANIKGVNEGTNLFVQEFDETQAKANLIVKFISVINDLNTKYGRDDKRGLIGEWRTDDQGVMHFEGFWVQQSFAEKTKTLKKDLEDSKITKQQYDETLDSYHKEYTPKYVTIP